jgi:cytochrome c oxidase subunit 1
MGGGALLAFFGATYYWFPKVTGRMLSERLGKVVFVLIAGGLHIIFLPQHFVGLLGMPRRTQTYFAGYGFEIWNLISTLGVFVALIGALIFAFDFFRSIKNGKIAGNDPWDARTLEWSITSPPPVHDFDATPFVTGVDAFWLAKHPEFEHSDEAERNELRQLAVEIDDHGIHVPGQSWWPFISASMMFIGGYAVIYHNWTLGVICVLMIVMSTFAWAFEGIGGKHVHPEGSH